MDSETTKTVQADLSPEELRENGELCADFHKSLGRGELGFYAAQKHLRNVLEAEAWRLRTIAPAHREPAPDCKFDVYIQDVAPNGPHMELAEFEAFVERAPA